MKIRISNLRKLIREVLDQQADVPGKWRAAGMPISREELDDLGDWGFGDEFPEDESLEVEAEMAAEIRTFVKNVLRENPAGPAVTADPTNTEGFYPYEVERGTDIHGYWYRSPGDKGSNNPGRPEDPADYIGMSQQKSETPTTT